MNQKKIIRSYSELIKLDSFDERIEYLRLYGLVGEDTFGFDRYLNQLFYSSKEWKQIRNFVITRDFGCDLGILDTDEYGNFIYEIQGKILIHHMNPLRKEDIINKTDFLLNPEYLICTSYDTHQFIHYGNRELFIQRSPIIRSKNDTCPWRH